MGVSAVSRLRTALGELMAGGLTPEDCVRLAEGLSFALSEGGAGSESSQGSDVSSRSSRRSAARARAALERASRHNEALQVGAMPFSIFLRTHALADAKAALGPSRGLAALAALPRSWFWPAVAVGSGPTLFPLAGNLGVDVARVEGLPLAAYFRALHRLSPELVHPSWRDHLGNPGPVADSVSVSAQVVEISLSVPAAKSGEAEGFCYLKLFPEELRVLRCAEFGAFPAVCSLAWAAASDYSLEVGWDGSNTWHVGSEGFPWSCTWGDLVSVVRAGRTLELGGRVLDRAALGGHRVGGGAPLASPGGDTEDPALVAGRQAFSAYIDALATPHGLEDRELPHVTLYVKDPDAGFREGEVLTRSRVVTDGEVRDGRKVLDLAVGYHGVMLPPPGCRVEAGGVVMETAPGLPRAVIFSGRVTVVLDGPDAAAGVFVKVLSRRGWQTICGSLWLLPYACSAHRLAYVAGVAGVGLVLGAPLRGQEGWVRPVAREVLHDATDDWLAYTEERLEVVDTGWYEVSTTSAVVVKVERGEIVSGFFRVGEGSSIVLAVTDAPLRAWMQGVHVRVASPAGAQLRVRGIADEYVFDGGGPSDGESCCSGERF